MPDTNHEESPACKVYDFMAPSRLPPEQAKAIQLIHEGFAETAKGTLSAYLGADIDLAVEAVEQQPFQDYLATLSPPTCIATVDMHPLSGCAVMEVNAVLLYTLIDKMLGGGGTQNAVKRPFTDLELSISKKFFKLFLKELGSAWTSLVAITFSVKDLFTNPSSVRAIPQKETCLVVRMKMSVGQQKGLVTIAVPALSLEPVSGKLKSEQWNTRSRIKQPEDIVAAHQKNFQNVEMPVSAILGQLQLSVDELLQLQKGDILDLGQKVHEKINITVGGTPKFRGLPGLIGKYKGVIIREEVAHG